MSHGCLDPWADPRSRSTLRFCNLHHGSTRTQSWQFYVLDPSGGLGCCLQAKASVKNQFEHLVSLWHSHCAVVADRLKLPPPPVLKRHTDAYIHIYIYIYILHIYMYIFPYIHIQLQVWWHIAQQ